MPSSTPQISKLRDIGWSLWDPIGLADHRANCDDEYDDYLVYAVDALQRGASVEDVARYLTVIEAEHMLLGARASALSRATATAEAIFASLRSPIS